MSRNSSGTYSLPAGNPVVSGTTVEASWANETLSDIATSLTNSLDRGGKGGMTASLKLADGTVSVPGMAFNNETNTGFYRASAGAPRLAILGTDVMSFTRGFAQLFGFNDSADSEPTFTLLRGTSSPAANDEIGKFRFDSRNDANEVTEYAAIQATINDPADGSEGGGLELRTMQSGVVTSALTIDETGKVTIPGGFSSNSASLGGITGNAVTQSATDTTAGRLTKVGDFGLGNDDTASIQAPGSDLNDLRTTGLWRTSSGVNANMPFAGVGQIWHSQQAGDFATQLLLGINAEPRIYFRELGGGAWSSWKVVYAQNSILGSVSQSAGVPTGAVIERGSNANGEFVKFADGTLIARRGGDVDLTSDGAQDFAFPVDFFGASSISSSVDDALASGDFSALQNSFDQLISNSAWRFRGDKTGVSTSVNLEFLAIGRWF